MSIDKFKKIYNENDGLMAMALIALVPFIIAAAVAAILLMQLYYGWAFSILWGWFVVPHFSLPAISAWHAAGLFVMISIFRVKAKTHEEAGKKISGTSRLVGALLAPLIILGFGWMIKYFGGM